MARGKKAEAAGAEREEPDKEIRFPVVITVAERWRVRAVAAILRRPAEDLAGEWLRERLEQEEKRIGIPKAK